MKHLIEVGRRLTNLAMIIVCSSALFAQGPGVQIADIDRSADPCTDFYQYANGAWRAANPIPASMTRWSRVIATAESTRGRLKGILEDVSRRDGWPRGSVEQLIGDYYVACTDDSRINRLGLASLKPFLDKIDHVENLSALQQAIRDLHNDGVAVPFAVLANPQRSDPSRTIAFIFANGFTLPDRDYYFKTDDRFVDIRTHYQEHIMRMFLLAGFKPEAANVAAEKIMRLETEFATASLDNVALRDPNITDHVMTFSQLKQLAPSFDWDRYFHAANTPHTDLNVTEPRFLQEVDHQLHATPLPDWKMYLQWQFLNNFADSLPEAFVQENFRFNSLLNGAKEIKPRADRCVQEIDRRLGDALGQIYVRDYFPSSAKQRIQELVRNELAAMHGLIESADWMSPQTKAKALDKLAHMSVKVGYPDKWKDYRGLRMSRNSYWHDLIAAVRWNVRDGLKLIGKPTDRDRWLMTAPTSDAYNNFARNEIAFPAGILLPPQFSVDALDAANYGGIGVGIGHEISHGFDDQGAKYDALGRLNNWWTPDDLSRFHERSACVERQFDNYFIEPGVHHNGKLVLGESIADLAGVKIAYLAFQRAQRLRSAPTVNGLTPEQQFFIAWGQVRGDEVRPERERLIVQSDPHPVPKFRVIGPLSNLPAFAVAFQCRSGTPMVRRPEETCQVW